MVSESLVVVDIPEFVPARVMDVPEGATHFRCRAVGAAIDFGANAYSIATAESAGVSISTEVQEPMQLSVSVAAASPLPLFLVFGIEFQQVSNEGMLRLGNGEFNAMAIVKVDAGR